MFRNVGDVAGRLRRDERGATFVEYIILVGIVALLGLVAFRTFSTAVTGRVNAQAAQVQGIQ